MNDVIRTSNEYLPDLPPHDHAFQDPEGQQPDIRVWRSQSMWAYAAAAVEAHKARNAHETRVNRATPLTMYGVHPRTGLHAWESDCAEAVDDVACTPVYLASDVIDADLPGPSDQWVQDGKAWDDEPHTQKANSCAHTTADPMNLSLCKKCGERMPAQSEGESR